MRILLIALAFTLAGCDSSGVLPEANATMVITSLWPAPAADAHDGHVYEYH